MIKIISNTISLLFIIIFVYIFNSYNCDIKIKDPKKFISDVVIDFNGDFKYILMEMVNKTNLNDFKYIVRGFQKFDYHRKIYNDFMINNVYKYPDIYMNFRFNVLGGGRISFENNNIKIYGASGVYGKANHKITSNLIKLNFPSYNVEDY